MQAKDKSVKLDLDYAIIFNAASNGMAFTEYGSGKIVDVNSAWSHATGIDRKKSLGKTAFELGLWADQTAREACIAQLKHDGSLVDFEAELIMKSVQSVYLISAQFVEMQGKQYVLWEFRDISERKKDEEALRASELKLSSILDNVDAYIYLKDTAGRYTFANRPVRELWHAKIEDIVGFGDEKFFDAKTTENIRHNDRNVLDEGKVVKAEETNTVPATGKTATYLSTKLPLRREDGSIYALCGISTDITELKQTTHELISESEKKVALLRNASDGIHILDMDGNVIEASDSFCKMLGYPRDEIIGMNVSRWDAQWTEAELAEIVKQHHAARSRIQFETRHRRKDGSIFDVEISSYPMELAGKSVMFYSSRDITERHRADEILRENEQRFRTLFELSPDPVWIIDGHRFVECNQAAVDMLGYPDKKALLNTHPSELSPVMQPDGEDSFGKAERMMNIAQTKGLNRFEWMHTRADGKDFYAEVTLSSITLGNKSVIYCVWRDISARKQAEEELNRSRERTEIIFNSNPDVMVISRLQDGIISNVNEAFCTSTGYSKEEAIGNTTLGLALWTAEDRQRMTETIIKYGRCERLECQFLLKNGSRRYGSFSAVVTKLQDIPHLISTVHDITDRKEAELKLQQSEALLRVTLESADEGILMTSRNNQVFSVNRRYLELLRLPQELTESGREEQRLAFICDQLIYPEAFLKQVKRLNENDDESRDMLHFKDGRVMERYSRTLNIGEDRGRIWCYRDVSDVIHYQQQLKESNDNLEMTLKAIPDLMFELDQDGRYINIFTHNDELLFAQKDTLAGHTVHEILPAEAADIVMDALMHAGKDGYSNGQVIQLDVPDGHNWFELSTSLKSAVGENKRFIMLSRDITERKLLEQELAESKQRMELALSGADLGMWDLDVLSGMYTHNGRFLEMIGYKGIGFETSVRTLEPLFHPDDVSKVKEKVFAHFKGETPFVESEFRMRHADGRWIWILLRGKVVERDENRLALRMTGTNLDITDRKLAEIKIQRNESLLRATLESADEGMLMVGHDGIVLSANPRFMELWKIPQKLMDAGNDKLMLAHVLGQLVDPDVFVRQVKRLYDSDEEARDTLHFNDGRVFARYTRSLMIGGERGRIWCFKDITEQTHAQTALAEREEIFRSIVTQANDGILLIDAITLDIIEFNDAACQNLGYNREEFAKLNISDIQGTMNAKEVAEKIQAIQDLGQMEFENRQRCKDGSLCPVRVSSRSILLHGHPYVASIVTDITERKNFEDELKRTKERYDFATMIGHVGTWDWNPASGVLVWSDETYRLMGYAPGSITPTYELYLGLVHPDDREMLNSGVQAALHEKKPYSLDCRIVLGNGKEIFCHVTGNVEFDADGQPIRMLGTIQDVTERKQVELDLQRKTERHLALLRNASDGIHILDTEGNVIEASDSFCTMLGYTLKEAIGMNVSKWDVQFSEAELKKVVAEQFATKERVQFETQHRRKDGSIIDVEVSGFPLVLEGMPVLFNSSRDISQRKRIESRLAESDKRLHLALDSARMGVWDLDIKTRKLYWSPEIYRHFDVGDIDPTEQSFLKILHPDDAARLKAMMDQSIAEGTPYLAEYRIAKNGELRWVEDRGEVQYDAQGNPLRVVGTSQDITERRQAEEALKESEERYRGIFDESIAVIYVFDNDKNFINSNQAGLDLLGYTREELLSMSIPDVDADPVAVEPAHQELDSGGRLVNFEHRLRRKDGTVITVLNNSRPLLDLHGNVVGILSTLIDITERKSVEDQLRKLAQAVEQSPESIVITNLDAKIEYVNAAFVRNTGYSREEVMGQNPRLLQSGKTPRESYDSLWHAITNGQLWKGEFYNRRKDGSEFIEFAIITPLRQLDGRITHYVAVKEDITEKKRISVELDLHRNHLEQLVEERTAALAARERHLNVILSGIPGVVGYWDKEQINRFANTAYHDWLGLTSEQIQGKTMREVFGEHIYELNRPLVEAALRGEPQVFERAYPHQGQPNEFRFARVHYVPDREGDDVVGFFVMAFDIDELKRARETAEAANVSKSAFLANMSHEIRTPLNAVLGMAKIGLRDNQSETTRKQLQHILNSGHHLLGVINDILDYSKIEADKMVVESHRFRLATVVEEIVNLTSVQAKDKNLSLSVLFAPDLPDWVMSDSLRLRQILVNLFSNAIKFTDHGSIVLSVMRQDKDILFQLVDSGIGMTDVQLGQLFQPFQQGDSSTTRRFGGTGLGLAISRKLAHLLGGEISVKSAMGEGSTFTLRLPLQVAEPGLAEQAGGIPALADHLRLKELRVLAAEDVDVNRIILEDLMVHEGAQVMFAENGQQAIDMIEEAGVDAFDVVLMDIQMPVMDGYESTRRIRELAPDLPVIGLTAHALEEERERCLACGMKDHVTKPIDTELLIGTILKHTGRSDLSADRSSPFGTVYMKSLSSRETPVHKHMIDWTTLNSRFKNRNAFIRKLAQTAIDTHTGSPDKLRKLANEADYQELAFLAHNLKGLAGNLAADAVQALAFSTEKEAKNREANALDHARQLADQLATTINELHDFIRSDP